MSKGNAGDFTCPTGTEVACLDSGDQICPGSSKCVDQGATCFDEYPCELSEGFICESEYDGVMNGYKQVVRQHDGLVAKYG